MSPSIRFPAGVRFVALPVMLGLLATAASARAQDLGPADGHDLPGTDIERVAVGDEAPLFTLESFDRGPVALSGFRGRQERRARLLPGPLVTVLRQSARGAESPFARRPQGPDRDRDGVGG